MSKESKNREIRSTKNKNAKKDKKQKSKKQKNKIKRKHRKGLDSPESDWTPDPLEFGTFSLTGSGPQIMGLEDENSVFSDEFKSYLGLYIRFLYTICYLLEKDNQLEYFC